ncbi:MAG: ATP-binding protein [Chloroflexota bacterium]
MTTRTHTVLDAEAHARVAAFEAFTQAHPLLMQADTDIRTLIDEPAGSAAFMVFGPTGVGKTTLVERVCRELTRQRLASLVADPQLAPPLLLTALAPVGSNFNWMDFLVRGLIALEEPGAGRKVLTPDDPTLEPDRYAARSIPGARRAFEAAVRERRPPAIFIDEAQHITNVGTGVRLLNQLDFVKSLADACESVFVLVGTYQLLALRNLNGQLGRRCRDVHLRRYRFDVAEEQADFASVVNTFAQQLPVDPELLLGSLPLLYRGSAGCVGNLKEWLVRALVIALRGGGEITLDHLERTALPLDTQQEIASEIAMGERRLAEAEAAGARDEVERLLGMGGPADQAGGDAVPQKKAPAGRKPPAGRRGTRRPGGDPVGAR